MVGSQNADWLQHAMNVLVGLFRRYGLEANVVNVMHNEIPAQRITGKNMRGGHGAEVHGVRRLVLSETPKADIMPEVWI